MVVAVTEKQSVAQTFKDMNGGSHNIASIDSMSRNHKNASVSMTVEGERVIVEVTPTEAINIMELLN